MVEFARQLLHISNYENKSVQFIQDYSSVKILEYFCSKLEPENIDQIYKLKAGLVPTQILDHLCSEKTNIA